MRQEYPEDGPRSANAKWGAGSLLSCLLRDEPHTTSVLTLPADMEAGQDSRHWPLTADLALGLYSLLPAPLAEDYLQLPSPVLAQGDQLPLHLRREVSKHRLVGGVDAQRRGGEQQTRRQG